MSDTMNREWNNFENWRQTVSLCDISGFGEVCFGRMIILSVLHVEWKVLY